MARMSPGMVGAGFMLAAAICFSTEDIIIKLTAGHLTVWQISFGRYLLGAAVLLLLARGSVWRLLGRQKGLLVLQAVLATILLVLLTLSIQMLPLSLALILFYLFPAFAALLSPWICRERVSTVEWGAVAVAVSGAVITLWSAEGSAGFKWGYVLVL
ncbi:MAG: EamA family transporter, partial [Deltaproteobacteria bacterium]|nr:EamA family transporter [Deltaproteobacteria bacterium]